MAHATASVPSRPHRRTRLLLALAVGIALAVGTAVPATGVGSASPGGPGIGDPYFPTAGNGGYDVRHYGLNVDYQPASDRLTGLAVITATATQDLSAFNLDLRGLTVKSVTVNGARAGATRSGDELTITPKSPLRSGKPFITTVSYAGIPELYESETDGASGFFHTDDGALVAGQPWSAASWFPVNDHPADKALYSIRITVPKGLEAISNGRLVWHGDLAGKSNWIWNVDAPMASYLATATVGQFEVEEYSAGGIRYLDAIDPDLLAAPVTPRTGDRFAWTQQANDSYKRLATTVTVPADDPELTFWMDRSVEPDWDFVVVEAAPAGTDEWTTLPDGNGATTQGTGNEACVNVLALHPFLAHYLADPGDGAACDPAGSSGEWWAATGASDGWEQWRIDLSEWAGQDVELAISYVSDYSVQLDGVAIDDVAGLGGAVITSFEDDGDPFDGWTVPGAPEGSPGNANDWTTSADGPAPVGDRVRASFARQPEIIDLLSGYFGPYPFRDAGGIVDDVEGLGFALENQNRPIYSTEFFTTQESGDAVVVHELAHQWFGDDVALERWSDIWLNEGFATYAEWLWAEHEGFATPQETFDFYLAAIPDDDPFWTVPPGAPGADALFDQAVYVRGALTVHALRTEVGEDAFWEIVRTWASSNSRGNGTTAEFIALAESVTGMQLDGLFDTWLFTPSKPVVAVALQRTVEPPPALKAPNWLEWRH